MILIMEGLHCSQVTWENGKRAQTIKSLPPHTHTHRLEVTICQFLSRPKETFKIEQQRCPLADPSFPLEMWKATPQDRSLKACKHYLPSEVIRMKQHGHPTIEESTSVKKAYLQTASTTDAHTCEELYALQTANTTDTHSWEELYALQTANTTDSHAWEELYAAATLDSVKGAV